MEDGYGYYKKINIKATYMVAAKLEVKLWKMKK